MNDMVDTRTTGTGLAERVCGGFRKDRRELGPEKAADKWFAPLMDRWNGLLSRDGGGFSHEERVTLAVLATEYLSMRDALILAALREMGGGELHMLYARPHSMESAAVVTCETVTGVQGRRLSAGHAALGAGDGVAGIGDGRRAGRVRGTADGGVRVPDVDGRPFDRGRGARAQGLGLGR